MSDWPLVRRLIVVDETGSTNDLSRTLLTGPGVALPMVVRARRQTRGRGRGSNLWWSDEGSLTFTLVLDPAEHGLQARHGPLLALLAASAVAHVVESRSGGRVVVGVRWPNDVEAGGRKLAGILTERLDAPTRRVMVGVGVNVSTRLEQAPGEVRAMATTVDEVLGGPAVATDLDGFLADFLRRIETVLPDLASDDPGPAAEWAARDTLLGQPVRVRVAGQTVEGVGRGIDAEGALLVATTGGVERLVAGEVLRSGR